jgi:hypothetical protein
VYRRLAGVDGATSDDVIFQQEFLQPQFTDTVNSARVYSFHVPVAMPAGKFYIGLIQPALSGSDSLFYALDVNRVGGNHLYFNVLNQWESSLISGALMVRPLLGGELPQSITTAEIDEERAFSLYPNPGKSTVKISGLSSLQNTYRILDAQGRVVASGKASDEEELQVGMLAPGVYFVQIGNGPGWSRPQRWIKL